jgi:hypothetical protein
MQERLADGAAKRAGLSSLFLMLLHYLYLKASRNISGLKRGKTSRENRLVS